MISNNAADDKIALYVYHYFQGSNNIMLTFFFYPVKKKWKPYFLTKACEYFATCIFFLFLDILMETFY